jgi:hypothetical protein
MRNGKQSVFRPEDRRNEPVNRQAAGVFRRAYWDEMPPAEPRFLPGPEDAAQATIKAAQARLAQIKVEQKAHRAAVKQREAQIKEWRKTRERIATCRQSAKKTLRTIHKRKGLPPPTWEEIAAFQKQQPLYGQKLHR